ncbi:MAG: uncharacterized protein A8A55_1354 [Amphiamblys sp. WSBS2006]|nr:MAG: uncharacterized protein A8A55_1354 [Amphiamblys sp. WSBS2006]
MLPQYSRRHDTALASVHLVLCIFYGLKKAKKIRQDVVSEYREGVAIMTAKTTQYLKHDKPDIAVVDHRKKHVHAHIQTNVIGDTRKTRTMRLDKECELRRKPITYNFEPDRLNNASQIRPIYP